MDRPEVDALIRKLMRARDMRALIDVTMLPEESIKYVLIKALRPIFEEVYEKGVQAGRRSVG